MIKILKRNYSFVITGTVEGKDQQDAMDKLYDAISCQSIESMGVNDFHVEVKYSGFSGVNK